MEVFEQKYGAEKLESPVNIIGLIVFAAILAYLIASKGIIIGLLLIVLPFIIIIINHIFNIPFTGFVFVFIMNFFALGITRYLPAPLGLTIDGLLVLTYISLIFKNFYSKVDWTPAANILTLLAAIWYSYVLFQLVNPEAVSRAAWFYAMRGVGLYMLLTIPLTFILFQDVKNFDKFLMMWAVFSILGTTKGIMQLFFGVDPFEQAWLDAGGSVTHILFGKLRIFSFYSDAGQFGASQGHTGVVFLIIAMNTKSNIKLRNFYYITGVLGMYGLLISGTRGAMAVPAAGFFLYLILRKNIKLTLLGILVGASVFIFLKYTTIMQSNQQIRRIRTALDPNNPSLQTRLNNQAKLKVYLASRPLGGGLGSAGNWGKRFSPNTFLANTATDSWYVAIWAELGIVGLYLHLSILIFILLKGCYFVFSKIKNDELRAKINGIVAGYFGIMAGSYGNGVLGQMPTGIIIYMSMTFIFLSLKYDKQLTLNEKPNTNNTIYAD